MATTKTTKTTTKTAATRKVNTARATGAKHGAIVGKGVSNTKHYSAGFFSSFWAEATK